MNINLTNNDFLKLDPRSNQTKHIMYIARTYLQLPLRQWDAGNVYLLVLSTLQISIGWLLVISSVIHLALKVILPIRIIPIVKIL